MTAERRRMRGVVLVEDKRSERFCRHLLRSLGYETRQFTFDIAPSGMGAAETWVRKRYLGEVRALRSRSYQQDCCLIAVRDGDRAGVTRRKAELDGDLDSAGMDRRGGGERIATPVPTWSIETWLFDLLGEPDIDETIPYKIVFDQRYGGDERNTLRRAAKAWVYPKTSERRPALPSMGDGRREFDRVDPSRS